MGNFLGSGWFCLLMVAGSIQAQTPSTNDLNPECLGNIICLIVDPLYRRFEVDVIVDDLMPSLATLCGMSVKMDLMGNVMFASVLSCFSRNMVKTFSSVEQLRLQGNHMSEYSVSVANLATLLLYLRVLPWAPSQSTRRRPSPHAAVPPSCCQSRRCSPLRIQTANESCVREAAAG
ncbi:uncharacterized protein ACWYII_021159 isoform 2-T2 [Salvelinus alpinus]